jgi:hypothetical protein
LWEVLPEARSIRAQGLSLPCTTPGGGLLTSAFFYAFLTKRLAELFHVFRAFSGLNHCDLHGGFMKHYCDNIETANEDGNASIKKQG